MKELVLNVKGMMCEGCENRVCRVVKNIEGVEEVKADHKTGKVSIILNKDVDAHAISEVISDIGYEVE